MKDKSILGGFSGGAPERTRKLNGVEAAISRVMRRYGGTELFLPVYEYYDVLKDTTFGFNDDNIIRFIDRNTGKSMVLRPDFTPQVCRTVAGYMQDHPLPLRLFYKGRIFRNVNLDKGMKADHYQVGCEFIGLPEPTGDLEMLLLVDSVMRELSIGDYRIVIGDVPFTRAALELLGDRAREYTSILKLKSLDEADAFAADNGFSPELASLVKEMPRAFGGVDVIDSLMKSASGYRDLTGRLACVKALFEAAYEHGIPEDTLVFDAAETRGIGYYTGATFSILHRDSGFPIGGGGRYDSLMAKFGYDVPACGVAFQVEELIQFDLPFAETEEFDYLVVGADKIGEAEKLRRDGHTVFHVYDPSQKSEFLARYRANTIIE